MFHHLQIIRYRILLVIQIANEVRLVAQSKVTPFTYTMSVTGTRPEVENLKLGRNLVEQEKQNATI